ADVRGPCRLGLRRLDRRRGRAGPGESDTPEIREDGASISPRHAGLLEMRTSRPDIYFSFFMFTADLQPDDANYTDTIVSHMQALLDLGYDGFDLPSRPRRRRTISRR